MAHIDDRWHRMATGPDGRKAKVPTARKGHGKRWRVRYAKPDGKEGSRSFAREDEAKAFRSTVEAEQLRGTWIDPAAGKVTLEEYGRSWLKGLRGEATTRERVAERLEKHVFPPLGDRTLGQLAQRPSIVQAWLSGLPLAENYQRAIFTHLSAMLNAALDDGLIGRNPCHARSVRPPKAPPGKVQAWQVARVEAVRAELPDRYRALCDAGAGLGLRQGEVFGLADRDTDFLRNVVHVRRQVRIVGGQLCFAPPKGGRQRDVPFPESTKERLSAHMATYPVTAVTLPWKEPGGKMVTARLIFTTSRATALNRAYFGQLVWKEALRTAGVIAAKDERAEDEREHGFHALRHFYASVLLADRVDIRKLSEYLGHHDPGFTLRVYGHFIPDGGEGARRAIDALFAAEPAQRRATVERKTI